MEKSGLFFTKLIFKGIKFPVSISDIDKFEQRNPNILWVNVYTNEGNVIVPLRTTQK